MYKNIHNRLGEDKEKLIYHPYISLFIHPFNLSTINLNKFKEDKVLTPLSNLLSESNIILT